MYRQLQLAALCVLPFFAAPAFSAEVFTLSAVSDLSLSHSTADILASPPTPGSANVGIGTFSWGSLATDGGGNFAEFSGGLFTSSDWGGQGTFTSNPIDVSSFEIADIAAQYDGEFNNAPTEFSNFFYQLDGGATIAFGTGSENVEATDATANFAGIDVSSATSLVVGFEFNHNGSTDFFNVDSLTVSASAVPEPNSIAVLSVIGLGIAGARRRPRK